MEQKLYELHAEMCKVFSAPRRLEVLNLLRDKELSVGQLAGLMHIRQANLSQHLALLKERGVVKTRRCAVTIYYSLSNPKVIKAFDIIREILLERLSENKRLADVIGKNKRRLRSA